MNRSERAGSIRRRRQPGSAEDPKEPKTPHIVITDREPGLPFSKGLMASQVMVTGLSPYRAYQVAEAIEDRLRDQERASVTSDELAELALTVIGELAGERYAKNFLRWREVERLDVPLVILIGGSTGVGKSTIATQLAARLGIVRVVATDAIREVMRSMLSSELMPTLHTSSFDADQALREPPGTSSDALLLGFREQTAAVAVGINALIERASTEGTSIVIEGAHIVPGFVDLESHQDRILAVPFILGVDDEGRHLSHFATREDAVASRPGRALRGGIRQHPAAAAVREEPGALARRAGAPQLQLRPGDRRGDGSGHGTNDAASGRDP